MQPAADDLAEREHRGVRDFVHHASALLATADDPGLVQHTEVFRHVLLGRPERVGEFANARLTVPQPIEQPDPHRLTDQPKALRD